MSDGLDGLFDDDDSNANSSGQSDGGKLRKQLEAVLAQNRTLQEQLTKVQVDTRNRAVSELFAKHSIPAKARDFFPSDSEPTDEAVTAFVEKYGDLWGAQAASATTTPEEQAATNAAQQFASQASPSQVEPMSEEHYRAKFAEAKSKDELARLMDEVIAAGG